MLVKRSSAWFCLVFSGLGLLISQQVQANVSLKNGNFFVSYTDAIYDGGYETKLERVYNSKSGYRGIFGWGWGNEFEVRLKVSADGSVVIHEFGGGAENRFSPVGFSATDVDKVVSEIIAAAQSSGSLGTSSQASDYKNKLRNNPSFRNSEWERFHAQGKVQARVIPAGAQLQSNRFSYQYITKTADGYVRTLADSGKVERFNPDGRLVRLSDKNGNYVSFEYGTDGHLIKLVDNLNRKMFFEYNSRGLLAKLEAIDGKSATYLYNANDELVRSIDVDGNTYNYRYDNQKRHNLVEIGYSDKTKLLVTYYGPDKHENVKQVKDRQGLVTDYEYVMGSSQQAVSSVSVVSKKGQEVISQSKYEYVVKRKASGEEWTQKLITELDGERTETTYNECCGLPVLIKQGSDETTFEYDARGHVTKKVNPYEITELHYDSQANKVDRVVKTSKKDGKRIAASDFQYDAKGNLIFAKSYDGRTVKLVYDSVGRIRTLIDGNQAQISFKYNESSKPIEISDSKLGAITVAYNNSGAIKEVKSQAGPKVAEQVSASFQALLDIIQPAGVSLSF